MKFEVECSDPVRSSQPDLRATVRKRFQTEISSNEGANKATYRVLKVRRPFVPTSIYLRVSRILQSKKTRVVNNKSFLEYGQEAGTEIHLVHRHIVEPLFVSLLK